jgi:hypothetical protein
MDAAGVAGNLSAIADTPKPTHESQVRPLAKLKPEAQREVWAQAVKESNGHAPTAEKVEKVADNWAYNKRARERARHTSAWYQPVQPITNPLNVQRMSEEREARVQEAKLQHDLGLQLINTGYKVWATKLHPDKGGSREDMTRLNRIRDILKRAI